MMSNMVDLKEYFQQNIKVGIPSLKTSYSLFWGRELFRPLRPVGIR